MGAKHRACHEVRTGPARGPAGPTGMLGAVGVARGNKFCAILKYLSGSKQTTSVSIRQVRTVVRVIDTIHLISRWHGQCETTSGCNRRSTVE